MPGRRGRSMATACADGGVLLLLLLLLLPLLLCALATASSRVDTGHHVTTAVRRLCSHVAGQHELCENIHRKKRSYVDFLPDDVLETMTHVQLPGTKWCGSNDTATDPADLGTAWRTDACCRDHDYCPVYLNPGEHRYGVSNPTHFTLLACRCEGAFFTCLSAVGSAHAYLTGDLYFNMYDAQCLVRDDRRSGGRSLRQAAPRLDQRASQRGRRYSESARRGRRWSSPPRPRGSAQLVQNPWGGRFPEPHTLQMKEKVANLSLQLLEELWQQSKDANM